MEYIGEWGMLMGAILKTCDYCEKEVKASQLVRIRDYGHVCPDCRALIRGKSNTGVRYVVDPRRKFTESLKETRKMIDRDYTDFDAAARAFAAAIEEYRAAYDYRFPAPEKQVDQIVGGKLMYIAENIERKQAEEAAKHRTREEWEKLEEQYSADHVHAALSWEDVEADLFAVIEAARTPEERERAWEYYYDEIMHYQECAYELCTAIFDTREHGNRRYCCDEHKAAQDNAKERFAKTGTYLPQDAYIPKRSSSVDKQYKKRETSRENHVIERIACRREESEFAADRYTRARKQQSPDVHAETDAEVKQYREMNKHSEVISYNMYDLSVEEIKARGLWKYYIPKVVNT